MKKKLLRMAGILLAATMLTGCTKPVNPETLTPPTLKNDPNRSVSVISEGTQNLTAGRVLSAPEGEIDPKQVDQITRASLELFLELQKGESGRNIMISPLSIDMALGMTENGAVGDTKAEMEKYVNGSLSSEELNVLMAKQYNKMLNGPGKAEGGVDWNAANSIWFRNDGKYEVKEDFLNTVSGYYGADFFAARFDEGTLDDINAWVNENTHEMIPTILKNIPDSARMYLVNAIAFEGEWEKEYEEDEILEGRDFKNLDGSVSKVTMLTSKENRYFTIGDAQGFIKEYKGGEYAFVGILPGQGTPEELIQEILANKVDLAGVIRNAEYVDAEVSMPEFTIDYDTELSEVYKSMGMTIPFDEAAADFNAMMSLSDGSPSELSISEIIHKTHIEVDRKGTKAAAATLVGIRDNAEAIVMNRVILNRPFVYAIVDTQTGMPVFLGCQNSMN